MSQYEGVQYQLALVFKKNDSKESLQQPQAWTFESPVNTTHYLTILCMPQHCMVLSCLY